MVLSQVSTLVAICDKIYKNSHEMGDEDIKKLYKLCQSTFLYALELVDNGSVEKCCLENASRFYFRVDDGSHVYTLYPHINFCECPSYKESIDKKMELFICKHSLACMLSIALNKFKVCNVTEYYITE